MEVRIGIQNVAREIVFESNLTADDVSTKVVESLTTNTVLRLDDEKGRTVIVPAGVLGYVELGADEPRRVGFGAL